MTTDAYLSMETLPDVGAAFRQLRKAAGLTQAEVAAAVGMRQEALSRFEAGRAADFSLGKLLRLLQAVDARLDFEAAGPRRPTLDVVLKERRAGLNSGPRAR
jgi:HTH-type transcriptional regulator/antitoxin HipB